jgi:hypothetical protein
MDPLERFPDEMLARKTNGPLWELVQMFRYRSAVLGWVMVPAGFATDLASVPWFARWYVSRDGEHTKPAVIHDYLYSPESAAVFPDLSRAQADRVFYEALLVRGIRVSLARLLYGAVRLGGGRSYRRRT